MQHSSTVVTGPGKEDLMERDARRIPWPTLVNSHLFAPNKDLMLSTQLSMFSSGHWIKSLGCSSSLHTHTDGHFAWHIYPLIWIIPIKELLLAVTNWGCSPFSWNSVLHATVTFLIEQFLSLHAAAALHNHPCAKAGGKPSSRAQHSTATSRCLLGERHKLKVDQFPLELQWWDGERREWCANSRVQVNTAPLETCSHCREEFLSFL